MTIEYKFNTKEDLAFYILNAVCHDWIHDFNNYNRMGKILNVIMALVPSDISTDNLKQIDSNLTYAQKKEEKDQKKAEKAQKKAEKAEKDQKKAEKADSKEEEKAENADSKGEEKAENADSKFEKADSKGEEKGSLKAEEDIPKRLMLDYRAFLDVYAKEDAKEAEEKAKEAEEKKNVQAPPTTIYTPPPTVYELYTAQADQYFSEQQSEVGSVESAEEYQVIVNESINMYNEIIRTSNPTHMTRSNLRKLKLLQQLGDFIEESKLLVVSKLSSSSASSSSSSSSSSDGHGDGDTRPKTKNTREKKMSGGTSAISLITNEHIVSAIDMIISEIESETKNKDLEDLKNIFTLLQEVFIKLDIPTISPLEKFNNSIITRILSMFIVNECSTINIKQEAGLYLTYVLSNNKNTLKQYTDYLSKNQKTLVPQPPTSIKQTEKPYNVETVFKNIPVGVGGKSGGSKLNSASYILLKDTFSEFANTIIAIKATELYEIYTGKKKIDTTASATDQRTYYLTKYKDFIADTDLIKSIVGPQMYNAKTKEIGNIANLIKDGSRNNTSNLHKLIDTINDFIFDKIIQPYEDVKNQVEAHSNNSTPTGSPNSKNTSVQGHAKSSVQKISQLIAKKTLQLMFDNNDGINPANKDLTTQMKIIEQVEKDSGYTTVDSHLIKYFRTSVDTSRTSVDTSKKNDYVIKTLVDEVNKLISGILEDENQKNQKNKKNKKANRIINNAVQQHGIKEIITKFLTWIVCPTSSVCDGMGSFGSCYDPRGKQEYFDMDFNISYNTESPTDYYYGTTTLKENKRAVNITYGCNFHKLNLYNSLDIDISGPPVDLQANHSFKGVINRIIEIWKSAPNITDIDKLWELLENDAFFISILKVGSQKAIGDIFQEINSALENGGYTVDNPDVKKKNTLGLMGDTPSGVRVVKLLKDAHSGSNTNACGGYIGETNALLYFPIAMAGGGKNTTKNTRKKKQKHAKKSLKKQK